MATKGVIPSFKDVCDAKKNRKLRIGADRFGLLQSSDGVCQGTMTQVCWTRYSATTLANIGVFPCFARYTKRYRIATPATMGGGIAEQNRRAVGRVHVSRHRR